MCSSHQPLNGADAMPIDTLDIGCRNCWATYTAGETHECVVTYRVPLRSRDSDETFARLIRVYGPKDLANQVAELRRQYPSYDLGSPRKVA